MELYIQIRDGQPYEHPILGNNFREAFPHIDVNNLPPEFARFVRIEPPRNASEFEVDVVHYGWVNGVVQDIWTVRPMTEDERAAKMEQIKNEVLARADLYKRMATTMLEEVTAKNLTDAQVAFTDYLARLAAWTLVDPLNPQLPRIPRINDDGTVQSLTSAGSAPNVIG